MTVVLAAPLALTTNNASAHAPHDQISDVAISPTFGSDSTVVVISRGHLLRSTDSGSTWTEVTCGLDRGVFRLASPTLSSVTEGPPGSPRALAIAFDLSHAYANPVTVEWNTWDISSNPNLASTAGDYVSASGTLVFPPGSTRQIVYVTVEGDATSEADEAIVVATHDPENATIGGFHGLGFGMIIDGALGP